MTSFSVLAVLLVFSCCCHGLAASKGRASAHGRSLKADQYAFKDMEESKKAALKLLDLIYNRYEVYDRYVSMFWHLTNNMGNNTWEIFKYKWARKLLEKDASYHMTFTGSSVTAGHDNKRNNSFPAIVEKRLSKMMTSAGIKLTVNNIAQGANGCEPYAYCYESMGGLDPDFIGWEQSYNCGHDVASFELASRIAGYSNNYGLIYFSSSGAFKTGSCEPSKFSPPYTDEDWTPESVFDYKKWEPDHAGLLDYKAVLNHWWEGAPPAGSGTRYATYDHAGYPSVGRMGFNVWQKNSFCEVQANESWNGEHLEHCDAFSIVANLASCGKMRFMSQETKWYGSDTRTGAKHHPTKAFHMLRGEAIVWLHALTYMDAIYTIEEDKKSGKTAPVLYEEYTARLEDHTTPKIPDKPNYCDKHYHCEWRPTCFTDFGPHFPTNMTLAELFVGKSEWVVQGHDLTKWHTDNGYLDIKPHWSNKDLDRRKESEIFLKVSAGPAGIIQLCGILTESLKHALIRIEYNVTNLKDYVPDESKRKLLTSPHGGRHYEMSECTELDNVSPGVHVVGITGDPEAPTKISSIAHVISW